jgi:predicted pyridoxine 5'-phosphate oxidase superfamily flavin-nucleotide-binding protein
VASIDPALVEFLSSGVVLGCASRDARLVPRSVWAVGTRVEAGGGEVTVFLPVATAGEVVSNLRDTRRIALVATAPVDHRSVQLKGQVLDVRQASDDERNLTDRLPGEPGSDAGAAGRAEVLRAANPALAGARGAIPRGGSLRPDARARGRSAAPGTPPATGARRSRCADDLPARHPECFEGVIPAMMTTCSLEGEPNITEISQVHLVDDTHVALSHQFFNKTQRNVRENPHASVLLFSPRTYEQYRLQLRFDHPEAEGTLFDEMAARLQVIASHTGMVGVFKLRCADVYEVLSAEHVEGYLLPPDPRLPGRSGARPPGGHGPRAARAAGHLGPRESGRMPRDVARIGAAGARAGAGVPALDGAAPRRAGRLVTTASHGYGSGGVGAEVPMGEGLIGTVAARRRPMRVAGVGAELRYWRTIRAELQQSGNAPSAPEIPLPGLPDAQAQLALPLLVGDRLVGVLALESREPMAFDAWTETFLDILANQIALGIDRAASADDEGEQLPASVGGQGTAGTAVPRTRVFQLFRNDDCIFVDGEYLIRNVPAKILWKLLRANAESGRTEFSNRELRLDDSLGLPEVRDNLESRLILLRKRLEEKCPEVQIRPVRRGRFELQIRCGLQLRESDSA